MSGLTVRMLPQLSGPYFDFLILPIGDCWDQRGCVKNECFHNPNALRVQDVIVSVFVRAFEQSHPRFNYYGPTEYQGEKLDALAERLTRQIDVLRSCRTRKQLQAKLNSLFTGYCNEFLENWLPRWRRLRNELEVYGQRILLFVQRAQREGKAFLAMGI